MIRSTRLVDLVNTMDPKLVAAAFGMDPEAPDLSGRPRRRRAPAEPVNGDNKVRHLTYVFAVGALRRGKEIQQFLGGIDRDGRQGVRWLAIGPGR